MKRQYRGRWTRIPFKIGDLPHVPPGESPISGKLSPALQTELAAFPFYGARINSGKLVASFNPNFEGETVCEGTLVIVHQKSRFIACLVEIDQTREPWISLNRRRHRLEVRIDRGAIAEVRFV